MRKTILVSFLTVVFFWTCNLFAFDVKKVNQVKELVNRAAEYLAKTGDLNAFNDPKNPDFVKLPLYVFVYQCEEKKVILKAHPFVHKLVGKNIAFLKDKMGKFFALDLCRQVKAHPQGAWASYYWLNPKTKKIEEKFTYIKQVEGTPYQVAAGLYKNDLGSDVTLDKLNSY